MPKQKPLASVVVPVYNVADYLEQSIESILNQSFTNFELILVDDCSTDGSWDIIKKYAKQDKRIVSMRNSKNSKICLTLNRGIKQARGKYILRCDPDDVNLPERFAKQIEFMEKPENAKVGVCGGYVKVVDKAGNFIQEKIPSLPHENPKDLLFSYNPLMHSTLIIRKECFDKYGLYDPEFVYAEDLELWFRFGQDYHLVNLPEFLVEYRITGQNSILKKQKVMIKNTLRVRNKAVKNYGYNMRSIDKMTAYIVWLMQFVPSIIVFKMFYLFMKLRTT